MSPKYAIWRPTRPPPGRRCSWEAVQSLPQAGMPTLVFRILRGFLLPCLEDHEGISATKNVAFIGLFTLFVVRLSLKADYTV